MISYCEINTGLIKYLKLLPFICLFFTTILLGQTKEITLEEIWNGTFTSESMDVLHPMNNGEQYTVLNINVPLRYTSIDVYDYETFEKDKTLVNSINLDPLNSFSNYIFNNDESKILLATDEESIYRYSTKAKYFVYDVTSKEVILVLEEKI